MQIHRFSFWLIELVSEVGNWHCGLNCKKPQNSCKIMNVALAVLCSGIFIFCVHYVLLRLGISPMIFNITKFALESGFWLR